MVLYHVYSTYQLLECMVHRLLYYTQEDACLIVYPFLLDKVPNYKDLEKNGIFNNVFLMPTITIHSEEQIVKDIEINVSEKLPMRLGEFTDIYVAGVHSLFSIYLIKQNILFHMMEDGSGALSHPEVLDEINRKDCPRKKYELYDKYNLFYPIKWTKDIVKSKICNLNAQKKGFYDSLAVHFDPMESFRKLSVDYQKLILAFFHCPSEIKVSEKSVLLLTQHLCNPQQLTFEEQVMIYQYLKDYFFEGYNLIIKPHPDDIMFYDRLFPDSQIIREKFPSELLPFIFERVPLVLSTVSSTGVYLLNQYFKKQLFFNAEYEQYFLSTHRYYVALQLIQYLGYGKLYYQGVLECLVNNLIHFNNLPLVFSGEDAQVWLIDDIQQINQNVFSSEILLSGPTNRIYIFINTNNKNLFYQYNNDEIFDDIIPIIINKTHILEEYNYTNENDEFIYVYVKDENIQNNIRKFSHSKVLNASGCRLDVNILTEKQLLISRLKLQIKIKENLILEYLEKQKLEVKE